MRDAHCQKCKTATPSKARRPYCAACQAAKREAVLATGHCFPHRAPVVDGKRTKCERCIAGYRAWRLSKAYGISVDEYDRMLLNQGGGCAVCGSGHGPHVKGKAWVKLLAVDHDHETGRVRGILCLNCNNAIGQAKESATRLRDLAEYLEPTPEWGTGACA